MLCVGYCLNDPSLTLQDGLVPVTLLFCIPEKLRGGIVGVLQRLGYREKNNTAGPLTRFASKHGLWFVTTADVDLRICLEFLKKEP